MIGSGAQARRNTRRLIKKIGDTCEQFDRDAAAGHFDNFDHKTVIKELEKRIQVTTFEFIKDGKRIG